MTQEVSALVRNLPLLTPEAGKRVVGLAEQIAIANSWSGFIEIRDARDMVLSSLVIGDRCTPTNVAIAQAKIKTVLATGRSTSLQRERMKKNHQEPHMFGGQIGSLFSGGVVILFNGVMVGAIAFSGEAQEIDEQIVVRAVRDTGLDTDITSDYADMG